jgi:predicted transglutaminase-like cysteine proteinase
MRFALLDVQKCVALPLFVAALSASFPAAAASRAAVAMTLGSPTAPPLGFVEMCARTPTACGDDPAAIALAARSSATRISSYDRYFWSVALSGDAPAAGFVPRRLRSARIGQDLRGFGRALGDPPQRAVTPLMTAVTNASATGVSTDRASWSRLNRINRQVNRAIRERSDMASAGVADRWSLPIADGRLVGDCEDFALEKRRLLMESGVPAQALSIALVRTRWGESHAVLLVTTDRGELVLDSLSPWISHWSSLDYHWVQRQAPGASLQWVRIAST